MKIKEKEQAIILRKRGFSIKEISKKLGNAQSTVSSWVREVQLNKTAQKILINKSILGKRKGLNIIQKKRAEIKDDIFKKCLRSLKSLYFSKELLKIFCALLYWGEGSKNESAVVFTNSDPLLIVTFLQLFRNAFNLDETKFRICLHLHPYHKISEQKFFWSKITKIPSGQFIKIFKKVKSGKNRKKDYRGCVSIRYHDYKLALELNSIWKIFGKKYNSNLFKK